MVEIKIATYTDEYKEAVRDMIFDIQENELGRHSRSGRPDLSNIKGIYQTNKGNFWLATEGGQLIGTIALKDMGQNRGDLWRFYVRKDARRKGVGSKLFSALGDFARKNGFKKIFLSTHIGQEAANKFYTKMGLQRIDFLPEDFPHSPAPDDVFYEMNLEKDE